jgi:predicted RNA-binding Zn-ribbon protein involved in translation (DUF1610 family)
MLIPLFKSKKDPKTWRTECLETQHKRIMDIFKTHLYITIHKFFGTPPDKYHILYHLDGLQQTGKTIEAKNEHLIEISFPAKYPVEAPICKRVSPVFHPNISTDRISVDDFWTDKTKLEDLIVHIGEMISFQTYNTENAINSEAGKWAIRNSSMLPLSSVDLTYVIPDTAVITIEKDDIPEPGHTKRIIHVDTFEDANEVCIQEPEQTRMISSQEDGRKTEGFYLDSTDTSQLTIIQDPSAPFELEDIKNAIDAVLNPFPEETATPQEPPKILSQTIPIPGKPDIITHAPMLPESAKLFQQDLQKPAVAKQPPVQQIPTAPVAQPPKTAPVKDQQLRPEPVQIKPHVPSPPETRSFRIQLQPVPGKNVRSEDTTILKSISMPQQTLRQAPKTEHINIPPADQTKPLQQEKPPVQSGDTTIIKTVHASQTEQKPQKELPIVQENPKTEPALQTAQLTQSSVEFKANPNGLSYANNSAADNGSDKATDKNAQRASFFCPYCGAQNIRQANFCTICGSRLTVIKKPFPVKPLFLVIMVAVPFFILGMGLALVLFTSSRSSKSEQSIETKAVVKQETEKKVQIAPPVQSPKPIAHEVQNVQPAPVEKKTEIAVPAPAKEPSVAAPKMSKPVHISPEQKQAKIAESLKNAKLYFNIGSYDDAIKRYREVLRLDPTNYEASVGIDNAEEARAKVKPSTYQAPE